MILRIVAGVLLLVAQTAIVWSADSSPKVLELAVTTKIVKGKPIDSVHRISSRAVRNLYCFSRLMTPSGTETSVKHVWYRNGKAVAEHELPVKGGSWRTQSSKSVEKSDAGAWRVDLLDAEGQLLKSVSFTMN